MLVRIPAVPVRHRISCNRCRCQTGVKIRASPHLIFLGNLAENSVKPGNQKKHPKGLF